MSWGVQPSVMVGHSLGEFVAACIGGVFSLADALRLVSERGRRMQEQGSGAMIAIMGEPDAVWSLLDEQTSLAAINAPEQCVASGPEASIARLESRLLANDVPVQRLPISLAAHSPVMDPLVDAFRELVSSATLGPLRIPMVSTVTGTWAAEGQLSDPGYWAMHLRQTVRFSDAVGVLLSQPDMILIEVGPGETLTALARQQADAMADRVVVPSLRHPRRQVGEAVSIRQALGQVWGAGGPVDWAAVHGGRVRRVPLPTYPFDHERYWIDPVRQADDAAGQAAPASAPAPSPTATTATRDPSAAPRPAAPATTSAAPAPASAAPGTRKDRVAAQLASILSDLSGIDASSLDATASFAELGFDSLFLTQANAQFRKQFGVRITFRQLFEEAPSIDTLAAFIDSKLAPDALPAPAPETPAVAADPAVAVAAAGTQGQGQGSGSTVEWLIREQLRIMEQQLALVRSGEPPAGRPASGAGAERATGASAAPKPSTPAPAKTHYLATGGQGHRPGSQSRAMTERQQAAIDDLVRRYNARTPGSKRLAQLWRPRLADNRAIVGFDKAWKELVYQIVSERSSGSRIWDVDGNEYIDTANGFGTNLFGHSPDFVVAAVKAQLDRGFAVGVQSDLLGTVAEMTCAMTGNDRLAFTTSGGEAVETAIRVARTVTDRDKIAYFTDDIHGRSDIVLGRAVDASGDARTVPMVAGVPQRVVDDALVLEYGTDRALEVIREHADDLALVLVEPVRSRNPDLQPVAFLRELRRLADAHGFLLVFDEIVTGFRAHQGGVSALFDVRPDITTYGKVLGGGLPIGVVAGSHQFIDVIDGGIVAVRRRQLPGGGHHRVGRHDDQARADARGVAGRAHPPPGPRALAPGGPQPEDRSGGRGDQHGVRGGRPADPCRAVQLILPADVQGRLAVRRAVPVPPARTGDAHQSPVALVPVDGPQRGRHRSHRRGLHRCGTRHGRQRLPGPGAGGQLGRSRGGDRGRAPAGRAADSAARERRAVPRRAGLARPEPLEPRGRPAARPSRSTRHGCSRSWRASSGATRPCACGSIPTAHGWASSIAPASEAAALLEP